MQNDLSEEDIDIVIAALNIRPFSQTYDLIEQNIRAKNQEQQIRLYTSNGPSDPYDLKAAETKRMSLFDSTEGLVTRYINDGDNKTSDFAFLLIKKN